MRILKSNGNEIPVRATNMARLFYSQEFSEPLDGVLMNIWHETDESIIIMHLLKIIWAMDKAENMACKKSTPAFGQWLENYEDFDVNECAADLFNEIKQGFTHKSPGNEPGEKADPNLPQLIISIALKMGMSEELLNELTTQSLLDIFKNYAGKKEQTQERRFATPSEISAYYGA